MAGSGVTCLDLGRSRHTNPTPAPNPGGGLGAEPPFCCLPKQEKGAKAPSQKPSATWQAEARATLALAGLQPRVLLIDHVNATAAAYHNAVLVTGLGGLQRVTNFHWSNLSKARCLSGAGGQVNPSGSLFRRAAFLFHNAQETIAGLG